ncbi:MAG: hypothetical protein R6V01_11010 [Thermoplasmatota archaeon]
MMGKRAMALTIAMVLATVAFSGLMFVGADDHLPAELTVTVTDNYGTEDDVETYEGDEVYFNLTGWSALNGSADYTVQIIINEGTPEDMMYNETYDFYHYTMIDVPSGEHVWNVTVVNDTDSDERYLEGTLTVHEMPSYSGTGAVMLLEDETTMLDLRDNFSPEGMTVEITNETELESEGWTIEPDPVNATVWNITPPAEWSGDQEFQLTATHSYGEMIEQMIMVTVDEVDDPPVIESITYNDAPLIAEMWNYTWVDEIEGNMSEWREVINLTGEEDMEMMFMVNAMDVDTEMVNLTYEFAMDDLLDPYSYENQLNETNETIPENFTVIPDPDVNGAFWATMTVSDELNHDMVWLYMTFEAVNDAPTMELAGVGLGEQLDIETGEDINVSVTYDDIDDEMENLTVMWYIDGISVTGWNMDYFLYNWSDAGVYNVSVLVEDDDGATSEELYFWVNVTFSNTVPVISDIEVDSTTILTTDDLTMMVNYTDAEDNVAEILWTLADSEWNVTGETVTVTAGTLAAGEYEFSVLITDEMGETASDSITITINEPAVDDDDDDDDDDGDGFPILIVIIIVLVLLAVIIIIVVIVMKGKKGDEEEQLDTGLPEEGGLEG